ncbi:AAA domain-containing protein [Sphaerospermopsis aphanizomenoides]|uniref:AAA domain-containing protein n=1 Tax=Sphaerospermopsis aphanizomenoides TaxID=459663 RepID=UPI000AD84F61|nr:AAA domain-containing protein [Sphaerospermopsis aphanizomenoides]
MTQESQIRDLLQAWLHYIHIENLSNAKVEAGDDEQPNIWDSGVNLVGDRLLLEESLFKQLKQPFKTSKTKPQANPPSIAVAFPQLYLIEGNRRQFRPLFTIDISPIFDSNYRKSGWDLTKFEFQPVIPNLMQWYALEEETAESLVTKEGLKVFLETTFNRPFKTLQDFIGLISLPPFPVRSKLLPYLLNFGYVAFNHNLNKDFQKISEQRQWDWAVTRHPAYEYLFGQPIAPQHNLLFLGAFPTLPPDDYQAQALKHCQSQPLTAVIGPPGNGKTTLLLHKIAQQVVHRAVQLATKGEDESNLTLVTSTNNHAVNNVEELLESHFPQNCFYLSGGSKELVDTQVLPSLQAALDSLARETFNPTAWESAKQQLLALVQQLQFHIKQDEYYQQQKIADEQLLEQLDRDVQQLQEAIKTFVQVNPEFRRNVSPNSDFELQPPLSANSSLEPYSPLSANSSLEPYSPLSANSSLDYSEYHSLSPFNTLQNYSQSGSLIDPVDVTSESRRNVSPNSDYEYQASSSNPSQNNPELQSSLPFNSSPDYSQLPHAAINDSTEVTPESRRNVSPNSDYEYQASSSNSSQEYPELHSPSPFNQSPNYYSDSQPTLPIDSVDVTSESRRNVSPNSDYEFQTPLPRTPSRHYSDFQPPSPLNSSPDYSKFPLEAYQQIEQHLNTAFHSLPCESNRQFLGQNHNWLIRLLQKIKLLQTIKLLQRIKLWQMIKRFWQQITRSSPRHILKRLHKQIEMPVLATLATPFPFQIPLTIESLLAARQSVSQLLKEVSDWQQQQNQLNHRHQQLELLQRQLIDLQRQLTDRKHQLQHIQNRLATYPTQDFYSRFYIELHTLQVQLFECAWQFQQQEARRRKDEVMAAIKTYIGVLNNEWEAFRQMSLNWRNIYRDISLLFPVFLSTLHSIRRLFPYPDSGCINQVIVDEAGQIPPHQVFPVLVRCRQALIVGDPLQLEPVINLSDQKKEEYRGKSFLERGLTEADYDCYSPTATTAYHRAAGASAQPEDIGHGIILKYHYRCVPVIAEISDRLCNYGMVIKTEPKPSLLGANLIAYHVEGKQENYINWAEVDAVETLIAQLLEAGYSFNSPSNQNTSNQNTIGVISPYRRQANALQERLQSRYSDFSANSIGTVHTFQGGQKSAIIFSTRQSEPTDSLWFINRKPNLLNVAVSRARELFILVGNLERLSEGGYTKQLVEYIQQFGEIR